MAQALDCENPSIMGVDEVEKQIASGFPAPSATFSCFFYLGGGERCGAPSPLGSLYCATHLSRMYRTPLEILQKQAAESLVKCTSFNRDGLVSISCRDIDAWGELSNSFAALVLHGYQREEECIDVILSSLLSDTSFREIVASKLPPKWQAFETLVARLHIQQFSPLIEAVAQGKLAQPFGVRVYWNLHKRGRRTGQDRQIDVAIVTTLGMVEILIAVECKDAEVEIGDVEAFQSKLDDLGAHKGIIASSVGFQEGAKRAAEAYNLNTYHIGQEIPLKTTVTRTVPRFERELVGIYYEPPADIESRAIEGRTNDAMILYPSGIRVAASQLVKEIFENGEPELGSWPPIIEYRVPDGSKLVLSGGQLSLAKISLVVAFRSVAQRVTLPLPVRPVAFSIRDVISGMETKVSASEIPMTVPRIVEGGRFYVNLMCQRYYCEKVDDDSMTLFLLDDRQHGTTISARLTAGTKQSVFYFPIEDQALVKKLGESLKRYQK